MTSEHLQAETTNSILISYSRKDRTAVKQLYARLESLGFKLWRDLHDIEGGEPFWEEIKKGIDGCESVVLCMSKDSLDSKFVQMEWHYARQVGKRVVPVIVGEVDFEKVPRWMSRIDWKDVREKADEHDVVWASFIRTLNTPYDGRKVPFMADKLPDYFVNRPEEFEKIVASLVDQNGAVAITAAVKGAGGFGKTTLALALCHDNRIRGAFDDGVLWVTLGEKPTQADLIRYALDLCELITGERPTVETREAVKTELTKAISDRYMLLVIDDLWRKNDADIFLTDSPNSAVMITTRFDHTLPDDTRFTQNVDAMKTSEAVQLLSYGIDGIDESHSQALNALTDRLGEWAVIVRLANATLRKRIGHGDSITAAIDYANKALTRKGLQAFDSKDDTQRTDAVKATIEVSLELLDDEQQAQFARLAIFPEDVDIPFTTLEKLWDLDDFDTEDVTEALQDASLLQGYDLENREIRLHDVIRQYLIDEHKDNLQTWQAQFVKSLDDLKALPDDYCWRNIAYHLNNADQLDTLRDLLLDYTYLQAKLNAIDPYHLISDCNYLPGNRSIELLKSAIDLSAHVTVKENNRLAEWLTKHLAGYQHTNEAIKHLFHTISYPILISQTQIYLVAGGSLIRTLEGHTDSILHVALSGDYAISGSYNGKLRVWNWRSGEQIRILNGHTSYITSVALLGNYAVSSSHDGAIKVWNWQIGSLVHSFLETTSSILNLALSGDYLVSALRDGRIKVWNWQTGSLEFTLVTSPYNISVLCGHYVLSSLYDGTLEVWNWRKRSLVRSLKGHNSSYRTIALSGDYVAGGSFDNTTVVWNWQTSTLMLNIVTSDVQTVALSGDYVVSALRDGTLKVWNWQTKSLVHSLKGHNSSVSGVALSADYVVSGSYDKTLKVWNLIPIVDQAQNDEYERALEHSFDTHTSSVLSAALSSNFAVTGSSDKTLKVWNWQTGELIRTLTGHTSHVISVALLGNFAVTSSSDKTLKVWNWQTGKLIRTLTGHTSHVTSVALSGNIAVTSSYDKTLKVWNWQTGKLIRTLTDHTSYVTSVALSGNIAVTSSYDKTLKVWNWQTGELIRTLTDHADDVRSVALEDEFATVAVRSGLLTVCNWQTGKHVQKLEGHEAPVNKVALLNKFAFSTSTDQTLRVWNWKTGELITTFYADSPQHAVAIAPNFERIICGGDDGKVHFLRPNAALLRILRGEDQSSSG